MTTFRKTAIALSLAAAFGAVATPTFAQTTRAERIAAAREARAQAQVYDAQPRWQRAPLRYGWGGAYAAANGAWRFNADPNNCVIDEGYGRTSPCSN